MDDHGESPLTSGQLRFALAGPVQAWLGGTPVDLGPPQRRALLATLVMGAGRVLTPDALVDGLWGDDPPARPQAALQAHISVLRRLLEPARAPRQASSVLRSVGRGYLLDVVGVEVDLFLFRHRLAAARAARAEGRPGRAAEMLASACAQWDGDALAGLPGPDAALHRAALAEERLTAFEELVDLQLDRNPHAVPAVELARLLTLHPHRERLHALRMRLLAAQGRRVDALAVYADLRTRLVAELGVEPGPELRRAQRRVLADEPTPAAGLPRVRPAPAPTTASIAAPTTAPTAAPATGAGPIGRSREVDAVVAALSPAGVPQAVLVHGIPGVGTSAVAASAVARVAGRFPAGVHRCAPGAVVGPQTPGRSLLVVDGIHDPAELDRRLGAQPGGSAEALRALAARGVTVVVVGSNLLRPAGRLHRIAVPPLDDDAAWLILRTHLGAGRTGAEHTGLARIVRRSGGVAAVLVAQAEQLALRPEWSVDDFVDGLEATEAADPSWLAHGALHTYLGHGFDGLPAPVVGVLGAVCRLPHAEFTLRDVATVVPEAAARPGLALLRSLERLVDNGLLDSLGPGRFRFHPLVRDYARSLTATAPAEPAVGFEAAG